MKTSIWITGFMMWVCSTTLYGTMVEAEGRAPADEPMARSQALADALREAVRTGAGVDLVSESQTKNFAMEFDRMFSRARGYVKKYEVVSTGTTGDGFYVVKVKADVGEGMPDTNDKLTLQMMAREHQAPRVAIRIDEQIEEVKNGTLASDWLRNEAIECGLRVVELERTQGEGGMMAKRARALGRGQEAALRGQGTVSGCDYIIEGAVVGSSTGEQSFYGSKPGKKFSLGLNLKVVDAATGVVILTENAPSRDILIRQITSDTAAAREAVRQLMEGSPRVADSDTGMKLIRRIFAHWAAEMDLGAICKLEFTGMDLATAQELKEKLISVQNVGSVWIRSVDPAGVTVVDCEARLQPLELAALIESSLPGFKLDRSENRYLSFRPSDMTAAKENAASPALLYGGIVGGAALALAAAFFFLKSKHQANLV